MSAALASESGRSVRFWSGLFAFESEALQYKLSDEEPRASSALPSSALSAGPVRGQLSPGAPLPKTRSTSPRAAAMATTTGARAAALALVLGAAGPAAAEIYEYHLKLGAYGSSNNLRYRQSGMFSHRDAPDDTAPGYGHSYLDYGGLEFQVSPADYTEYDSGKVRLGVALGRRRPIAVADIVVVVVVAGAAAHHQSPPTPVTTPSYRDRPTWTWPSSRRSTSRSSERR